MDIVYVARAAFCAAEQVAADLRGNQPMVLKRSQEGFDFHHIVDEGFNFRVTASELVVQDRGDGAQLPAEELPEEKLDPAVGEQLLWPSPFFAR